MKHKKRPAGDFSPGRFFCCRHHFLSATLFFSITTGLSGFFSRHLLPMLPMFIKYIIRVYAFAQFHIFLKNNFYLIFRQHRQQKPWRHCHCWVFSCCRYVADASFVGNIGNKSGAFYVIRDEDQRLLCIRCLAHYLSTCVNVNVSDAAACRDAGTKYHSFRYDVCRKS